MESTRDPYGDVVPGGMRWPGAWASGGVAAESRGRQLLVRTVAVAAIALSLVYLGWRVVGTLAGATWWLALPLLLLEVHALVSLAFHTFDLWDLQPPAEPPATGAGTPSVAVLIPTYNEAREILLPTVAAAVALAPAAQVGVDFGDLPEEQAAALALELFRTGIQPALQYA